MAVPFIDIKRFEDGFLEKWEKKVKTLTQNASFIGGEEVQSLEKKLSEEAEVKHAVTCANGTDALQLALRAMGVGRGDKVLIPDSTFWATFEAVVNVGADPITVDPSLEDLQMDWNEFQKAAEHYKPKAAILVHLYGWGSKNLEQFREYCQLNNILLLEDGAQCFGVQYKNSSIYKNAYIATTSFYPAKVLGAAGDGGAVFTNHDELATIVKQLGNHGRTSHYSHGVVGWNSRMDALQAAYLNLCLEYFQQRIESRRKIANLYRERLPKLGLHPIKPPEGYLENGYCNAILLDPKVRKKLEEFLKSKGIGYGIIYPGAMSDQPGAQGFGEKFSKNNTAREICQSIINLPLFAYMKESEFEEVYSALEEFFK